MAQNNVYQTPVSTGQDLAVAELDVRCQTGLPSHRLAQLGVGRSAFCSGVWSQADPSWAAGQKASASSCGHPQGAPNMAASFIRRARGRERGKERERERERGREREREGGREREREGGWAIAKYGEGSGWGAN